VVPSAGGPTSWERIPATDTHPTVVPEPRTVVTDVAQTDSSVSFRVSRVGTPVEVKVSYFPNWKSTGAQGPWRVAPNLMVVVPTSRDVTLTYGASASNQVGEAISLVAVAVAVGLVIAGRRARRRTRSAGATVSVP
jgi:uncharacterized membrane protein